MNNEQTGITKSSLFTEKGNEIVEVFDSIEGHIVDKFFRFVAKGYSFRECEEVLGYIGRMKLTTMENLVFIKNKFYSERGPNYKESTYEHSALDLIASFAEYPDNTPEIDIELLKEIMSKEEAVEEFESIFKDKVVSNKILSRALNLIESNKYLNQADIVRLRTMLK